MPEQSLARRTSTVYLLVFGNSWCTLFFGGAQIASHVDTSHATHISQRKGHSLTSTHLLDLSGCLDVPRVKPFTPLGKQPFTGVVKSADAIFENEEVVGGQEAACQVHSIRLKFVSFSRLLLLEYFGITVVIPVRILEHFTLHNEKSTMVLTDRQRHDLHLGIYEYLKSKDGDAFQQAAAAFALADPEVVQQQPDAKPLASAGSTLLEKKWTAIPRLQKKVMELDGNKYFCSSVCLLVYMSMFS